MDKIIKNYREISFAITITNGITVFTQIGKPAEAFNFEFILESIIIANNINGLAKLYPIFNKQSIEGFNVSGTTLYVKEGISGIQSPFPSNTTPIQYILRKELKAGWNLDIYALNTHTASQIIYLTLIGYTPLHIKENDIGD